jgi:DNA replication protein DnaC
MGNMIDDTVTHFGLSARNEAEYIWNFSDRSSPEAEKARQLLAAWKDKREKQDRYLRDRGKRYRNAKISNFEISSDAQQQVVDKLVDYAANANRNIPEGKNVLLVGPKGTGKDHLLTGLAKEVFNEGGFVTQWKNGCVLVDGWRNQAVGNHVDWDFHISDNSEVLYISDLLPPAGSLSDYVQSKVFALVDRYYNNQKPIWLSLNVATPEEAESRLGAQAVDRLRHDALIIACNWQSYRTAKRPAASP